MIFGIGGLGLSLVLLILVILEWIGAFLMSCLGRRSREGEWSL